MERGDDSLLKIGSEANGLSDPDEVGRTNVAVAAYRAGVSTITSTAIAPEASVLGMIQDLAVQASRKKLFKPGAAEVGWEGEALGSMDASVSMP
jgi:hypothetical protein